MHQKGITPVIAVVLILIMTVAAAGVAYTFISGVQSGTQAAAKESIRQLQQQASSCMSIDSISRSTAYLRNCGEGIIQKGALSVFVDGVPVEYSLNEDILQGMVAPLRIYTTAENPSMLKIINSINNVFVTRAVSRSNFEAAAFPQCSVPASGNWIVDQTCSLAGNVQVLANVIVKSNAVLIIGAGTILNINLKNHYLKVERGGGVLVKKGGRIGSS